MDIVISSKSSIVDGIVIDARRQPVAVIDAVLIPDQRERIDLFRSAATDREGHFIFRGIPPGSYKLFAWEDAEPYAYFDPEFVRQSEQQARAIRVAESSSQTVEIRSIP